MECGSGGLHLHSGSASLRHWSGNPYYLRSDSDHDDVITDPFDPDKPLSGRPIIAWSAGKGGNEDLGHPEATVNGDTVHSWN